MKRLPISVHECIKDLDAEVGSVTPRFARRMSGGRGSTEVEVAVLENCSRNLTKMNHMTGHDQTANQYLQLKATYKFKPYCITSAWYIDKEPSELESKFLKGGTCLLTTFSSKTNVA